MVKEEGQDSTEQVNSPKDDRLGDDYSRGPNPNPGGDLNTGDSAMTPYEGRTESTSDSSRSAGSDHPENIGGGAGPVDHDEMKSPEPESTPGGATASPADEQPASEAAETVESDRGGPAHYAGTTRGEDAPDEAGKEAGREDTGTTADAAERPTGESSERDLTGVDPQDGTTDRSHG